MRRQERRRTCEGRREPVATPTLSSAYLASNFIKLEGVFAEQLDLELNQRRLLTARHPQRAAAGHAGPAPGWT
jgi:hypothetical protein